MIRRISAGPFLVCWWCAAQATQDSGELDRRLHTAEVERTRGHLPAAESIMVDLEAELERTKGSDFLLAAALREHGMLRDDAGRSTEAISFYERALGLVRAQPDVSPLSVGLLLADLANSHADHGDSGAALALSTEAMNLLRPTEDAAYPAFAAALYAHGFALHRVGRNTEALPDLRKALNLWQRSNKPDYAQMALIKESMAACFAELGYSNQAETFERDGLGIRLKNLEPNPLSIAADLNNLGVILVRAQRFTEALQSFEKAVSTLEQSGESERNRLADVLGNLGRLYYEQARNTAHFYAKAEDAYRRKLAIEEKIFGASDLRVAATLETLGEILYSERAYDEAGGIYSRGVEIQQAALGSANPATQAAVKRYKTFVKKMHVPGARSVAAMN